MMVSDDVTQFKSETSFQPVDHSDDDTIENDLRSLTPALYNKDYSGSRYHNTDLDPSKIGVSQIYGLLKLESIMTEAHLALKLACEMWFESSEYYYRYVKQYEF